MSYRVMRLLVMFDLPVHTKSDQRVYRHFRQSLIKNGYIMVQYSVYSKILYNPAAYDKEVNRLHSTLPDHGYVQTLKVTEKQYSEMQFLVQRRITEYDSSSESTTYL